MTGSAREIIAETTNWERAIVHIIGFPNFKVQSLSIVLSSNAAERKQSRHFKQRFRLIITTLFLVVESTSTKRDVYVLNK